MGSLWQDERSEEKLAQLPAGVPTSLAKRAASSGQLDSGRYGS